MTKLSDGLETRLAELEQRNAALEQKNAALEQRLTELEPKPAPKRRSIVPSRSSQRCQPRLPMRCLMPNNLSSFSASCWRNSRVWRRMANAARRLTNSMRSFSGRFVG